MALPMAAWRVTYTPGEWLVLSGPTMLVVLLPAPARMSQLVNALWDDVVAARSVDALLALLGEYGLDAMPDFAAFFWDAAGLHGMARGRITVVDTDTGETAVTGADVVTWREEALGDTRHLRVDMESVDQDQHLQLPLVVGAVSASAIYLTTDTAAQVRFTEGEHGILPRVPVLGVRPGDATRGDADASAEPGPTGPEAVDPGDVDPLPAGADDHAEDARVVGLGDETEMEPYADAGTDDDPGSAPEPEPGAAPESEAALEPGTEPSPEAGGVSTEQLRLDDAPEMPSPAPDEPVDTPPVTSGTPHPASAPAVVPGRFTTDDDDDDEGGTVFSTGLAATHKPPTSTPREERQVLAVPCARGHANAPGSRTCRLCSAPVDSSTPRLISRPTLAGVHSNTGDFADLHVAVLVGRSPDADKAPRGAHLMRVHSPSSDISRSHLIVTPRDWSVIVTDLHSTNGTTVMPVGEQPFILANGDSVQVDLGTVLDLGDGVSLRIEPPRG